MPSTIDTTQKIRSGVATSSPNHGSAYSKEFDVGEQVSSRRTHLFTTSNSTSRRTCNHGETSFRIPPHLPCVTLFIEYPQVFTIAYVGEGGWIPPFLPTLKSPHVSFRAIRVRPSHIPVRQRQGFDRQSTSSNPQIDPRLPGPWSLIWVGREVSSGDWCPYRAVPTPGNRTPGGTTKGIFRWRRVVVVPLNFSRLDADAVVRSFGTCLCPTTDLCL
jgi:hypothetical protein